MGSQKGKDLLFNSSIFLLCFLPIVLLIYYRLTHARQNVFLVLASLVFYASWDWRFLAPLLITTSLDFWVAKKLEECHKENRPKEEGKKFVVMSVVANLTMLGFFKYFNFFVQSATELAHLMGFQVSSGVFEIILPLGISFYTFQALSYTIDVYRGELHATKSFWDFFLAVLYFPHLIAGPIQRASQLLPQVIEKRIITVQQVQEGLHLVFWGFFKKVFIADNLAPIVTTVFAKPDPSGAETLVGVLAFTFQIYGDFSGYTDIARGLAKLMGFEFSLNFNLPYFAMNPSDFWRRWHISLSTWLRDYLYKPLGGNRNGYAKTQRNLMLTMVLGGLWHGAAWNFVLWGFYHGLLLVVHRQFQSPLARLSQVFSKAPPVWWLIRWGAMFVMTCYGWLLFRATSLEQIGHMSAALFSVQAQDLGQLRQVLLIAAPLVLVQCVQFYRGDLYFLRPEKTSLATRVVLYTLMVYMCLFQGGEPQSFVYFQF